MPVSPFNLGSLTDDEFAVLAELVEASVGIHLAPMKKTMMEARLHKRARFLGMHSLSDYSRYIGTAEGRRHELVAFIDAITTNKTEFFREPQHFELLHSTVMPEFSRANRRSMRVWSAACSSGEEPYSLAMMLNERARTEPPFRFSLLATDIAPSVLDEARRGVYDTSRTEQIPEELLHRYALKSRDPSLHRVKMGPALRAAVDFRQMNLVTGDFSCFEPFDVIFCRNVLMYFRRPTVTAVLRKLSDALHPGGYLFVGLSENITHLAGAMRRVAPSVLRKEA